MPEALLRASSEKATDGTRSLRVALVIHSLGCGGAEKVAVDLARRLHLRGHEPLLITLDDGSADFHTPPTAIKRIALDVAVESRSPLDALYRNHVLVRALRRALASSGADIALAFMDRTGMRTVLATRGLGLPVVVAERTDPRRSDSGLPWRLLRRPAYSAAAAVVANSVEVADWLRSWLPAERVESIPNSIEIDPHGLAAAPEFDLPAGPMLLSVGRLAREKGHADLIRAVARAEALQEWSLMILGEGPERANLAALAEREGVAGRLFMPGRARNPWPFYRAADLFVLPSKREGFPNALLEAMAAGACCVACDTGSGAREMIRDGVNGRLVPEVRALPQALAALAADPRKRSDLGRCAVEVAERYRPDEVVTRWEALLVRCATSQDEGGSRARRSVAR